MTWNTTLTVAACSLLVWAAPIALAATPLPTPPDDPHDAQEAQRVLERKARALLDEVIAGSWGLKRPENRLRVQAASAHVLWPYDERRARALFAEVLGHLRVMRERLERTRCHDPRQLSAYQQLSQQLLPFMSQHDDTIVHGFSPARTESCTETTASRRMPRQPHDVELEQAAEIAAADPQEALRLTQRSLDTGVSAGLIPVVVQLQEHHPQPAAQLARTIVEKLAETDPSTNPEAASVAADLLLLGAIQPGASSQHEGSSPDATPLLDEEAAHQLLSTLVERMAEQLQHPASPLTVEPVSFEMLHLLTVLHSGPALTGTAGQGLSLSQPEGPQTAPRDPAALKPWLGDLDPGPILHALEAGDVEDVRGFLIPVESLEHRAYLLMALALDAAGQDKRGLALELLDAANTELGSQVASAAAFRAQLAMAHASARIQPARSLARLEVLVAQLNRLLDAAFLLNGFSAACDIQDGELLLSSPAPLPQLIYQCARELSLVVDAEFERAASIATAFDRQETRVFARLVIAQGALASAAGAAQDDIAELFNL